MSKRYLLLARDAGSWSEFAATMSAEEIQAAIGRYIAWSDGLRTGGKLVMSEKLTDGEGRVVKGGGDGMRVTDGPHVESKEVIGGFWIIEAADYDEAIRLAADSPHLEHGTLEIREIEVLG